MMSTAIMDGLLARGIDVELADRLGFASVNRAGTEITPEVLRALLAYDAGSGELTWLARPLAMFPSPQSGRTWNTRYAGHPALTATNSGGYRGGYVLGRCGGRNLLAHRIAWAIHHGRWPLADLDHINGDRRDNRIANLREVTGAENARNQKLRSTNKSGVAGVFWYAKLSKWSVSIRRAGRSVHLGYFATLEAAATARAEAERSAGYHPNHGRAA